MKLQNLTKQKTKKAKRIGRGYGSMKGGHTSTRGQKGQKSRSGYKLPRTLFEGGQNSLAKRVPKLRGFKRSFAYKGKKLIPINVGEFNELPAGTVVNEEFLLQNVEDAKSKKLSFKILSGGELTKKLVIEGIEVSKVARAKIEKAGGTIK